MLLILRTVAGAPYNYNFLDTTKEPSAYLPRAYPYVYWLTFKNNKSFHLQLAVPKNLWSRNKNPSFSYQYIFLFLFVHTSMNTRIVEQFTYYSKSNVWLMYVLIKIISQ